MKCSHSIFKMLFSIQYCFFKHALFVSTEQLSKMAPSNCPHLVLQAMAGPLAAATASTVTNPMDVIRARVQVIPIAHSIKSDNDINSCHPSKCKLNTD